MYLHAVKMKDVMENNSTKCTLECIVILCQTQSVFNIVLMKIDYYNFCG